MQQGWQDGNDFVAALQAEIDRGNSWQSSLCCRENVTRRAIFTSKMTSCFSANLCVSIRSSTETGRSSGTCSAISSEKTRLNTICGQTPATRTCCLGATSGKRSCLAAGDEGMGKSRDGRRSFSDFRSSSSCPEEATATAASTSRCISRRDSANTGVRDYRLDQVRSSQAGDKPSGLQAGRDRHFVSDVLSYASCAYPHLDFWLDDEAKMGMDRTDALLGICVAHRCQQRGSS